MEKESKSCTDVLFYVDLTGHGHPSPFCQKGWDGCALLDQSSKGGIIIIINNVLLLVKYVYFFVNSRIHQLQK